MKIITTLLVLIGLANIAQAQYFHHGHHHFNNKVNKVIVEQKIVDFEDAGVRVIGVPINLLELDYYWYYDVHKERKDDETRQQLKEELKAELLDEVLQNKVDKEAIVTEILEDILRRLDGGTTPAPKPTPKPTPQPDPKPTPTPTPTEPKDLTELDLKVQKIFEKSCNNCHAGESVPSWASPSGFKYPVTTDGEPADIPQELGWALYKSVLGIDANIKRMPKGGKPLDAGDINTILEWNIERCK